MRSVCRALNLGLYSNINMIDIINVLLALKPLQHMQSKPLLHQQANRNATTIVVELYSTLFVNNVETIFRPRRKAFAM